MFRCLWLIHLNPRRFAMILLTSITDHVVLLSILLLMIGLARLAYGGRQI